MLNPASCSASGCARPPAAVLDVRSFCVDHFFLACYAGMDHFTRRLREERFQETGCETVRQFLSECTRQTADLAGSDDSLGNLDRARVLDILLRASELGSQLRRSPRLRLEIPVKLQSIRLGHGWEEISTTRVISQHGAALSCFHSVENGATLTVIRLDTGQEGRARVAWSRVQPGGCLEIGIEFPDAENFWDLDWNALEVSPDAAASPHMMRSA